jgi:hypothetical protein
MLITTNTALAHAPAFAEPYNGIFHCEFVPTLAMSFYQILCRNAFTKVNIFFPRPGRKMLRVAADTVPASVIHR